MAICKNGHRISLLIESCPKIGLQTFSEAVRAGSKGICISRMHPDYVSQKFGLEGAVRYWLSDCKGRGALSPRALGQITKVIRSSIAKGSNTILLDGLEYLLLYNDMARILAFLEEIDYILAKAEAEMVICIDPCTYEPKELDRLYALLAQCTPEEMALTLASSQSNHGTSGALEGTDQTT